MIQVTRDKARGGTIKELTANNVGVQFDAAENISWFSKDRVANVEAGTPDLGTQAVKHDLSKTRLELIPPSGIEGIGRAMTFGASKYAEHNWANGFDWDRLVGSVLRHMNAWRSGEDKDPESGLSHLDHAGAAICMLIAHETEGLGNDDRRKTKY